MKKVSIILAALLITAIFATSCKTTQKCPAYGEHGKYQKEKAY